MTVQPGMSSKLRIAIAWPALAALCLLTSAAAADSVYRCEIEGVTVFSDRPCADHAELMVPTGSLSVVSAPENLDQIAAANRTFIDQRLARQAELERERVRADQTQPQPPTPAQPPRPVLWPGLVDRPRGDRGPRRPPGAGRPERSAPEPQTREEWPPEYSALSGRLPGTRRRED